MHDMTGILIFPEIYNCFGDENNIPCRPLGLVLFYYLYRGFTPASEGQVASHISNSFRTLITGTDKQSLSMPPDYTLQHSCVSIKS